MNSKIRILVADQEKNIFHTKARLLQDEGYECEFALNAETAKQLLEKEDFNLLILNIKLPGKKELEIACDLPQIAEGLPVILVTDQPSLNSAIKAIELPVVAYLIKPIEFKELLFYTKKAIQLYKYYNIINDTKSRFRKQIKDIEYIRNLIKEFKGKTSPVSIDNFIEFSMLNIFNSLADLKSVIKAQYEETPRQNVCKLFNCPRLITLMGALMEAIDVLEKTKSSFKSKDLGVLRKKLTTITENLIQKDL